MEVLSFTDLRHRLPGRQFTRLHRLDFHRLTLVEKGHGTAIVDFVDRPCQPGTLLHTRPGQLQRLPTTPDGSPADLDATIVSFTPDFPPRLPATTRVVDDPFGPISWQLDQEDHDSFRRALTDLAAEYATPADREPEITKELLRQLLTGLLLRIARLPAPDDYPAARAQEAPEQPYRLFRHELERSFVVQHQAQHYAARLGCSVKTLNRACKNAVDRTAKQLIDARIALEAQRLLAYTDLPIAAVSRRLGFTEPTNFGKFFTRVTGHTPGAFRATQGG
ncbi:helix-turn-helix domain-containing protein [Streptomyces sp. HMX112]|uniref:helix-turn-helix domain-containing protein n=1 Tax=Streptomyces sp. HMX112 TaxID=3390850 RepID=UPI003A8127E9